MPIQTVQLLRFVFALALALASSAPLNAGEVRVSFLRDATVLQETVRIMRTNGFRQDALDAFAKVVSHYNGSGPNLGLSRFPASTNGFYLFSTPQSLVAGLPSRLSKVDHPWDFNCFDALFLLTSGHLETDLRPDEICGPFLAPVTTTNGTGLVIVSTPRDAFNEAYFACYRQVTEELCGFAIPRHGNRPRTLPGTWPATQRLLGGIDVAFFDGHAQVVPLENLWWLYWHKDYVPPLKRPGLR